MKKFLGALTEASLAWFILASPALAQVGGYIPAPGGDQGGPLPVLGAGLPFLLAGGGFLAAHFLRRKRH
jgi:hypothetical protein